MPRHMNMSLTADLMSPSPPPVAIAIAITIAITAAAAVVAPGLGGPEVEGPPAGDLVHARLVVDQVAPAVAVDVAAATGGVVVAAMFAAGAPSPPAADAADAHVVHGVSTATSGGERPTDIALPLPRNFVRLFPEGLLEVLPAVVVGWGRGGVGGIHVFRYLYFSTLPETVNFTHPLREILPLTGCSADHQWVAASSVTAARANDIVAVQGWMVWSSLGGHRSGSGFMH